MTRGVMAAARGDFDRGACAAGAGVEQRAAAVPASRRGSRGGSTAPRTTASPAAAAAKKVYGTSVLDRVMEALVFYLDRRNARAGGEGLPHLPPRPDAVGGAHPLRRADAARGEQLPAVLRRPTSRVMDKYAISLMNLCGTAILLCAGLSRFIFPLISLEGRKFWILGLTPVSREQILRGKFAFAATGSLVVAEALILRSDVLLGLPWEGVVLHAVAVAVIALGLSGLNVGLGAYLPNFRETDPSKIVVGFGGTVNMVVGLGFLVAVIGLMAVPFHVAQLAQCAAPAGSGEPVGVRRSARGAGSGGWRWCLPLRAGATLLAGRWSSELADKAELRPQSFCRNPTCPI